MVYEKSALGYNEFTNNNRTLNVRERQVLLLVNGVRNLEDLEKFFKKDLLTETLIKLELEGFIYPANTQATPVIEQSKNIFSRFMDTQTELPPINPAKIAAVKNILLQATDDYLGLMGRSIKDRISKCNHQAELRNCISAWHMAMRESKLGRESADFLMEQIHQTLENKMLDTESNVEHQTH